jgi:hypothetical protein
MPGTLRWLEVGFGSSALYTIVCDTTAGP